MGLGFYENFPENVHTATLFTATLSSKKLQQSIIQTLHELNNQTFSLEEVSEPSVHDCAVIFEFGIAESNSFNYLDDKESTEVLRIIKGKPFQIIDLLCAVRYYKSLNEKRKPLKFDYYMIRSAFHENSMEMFIFHERGPRHISPEDISNLIVRRVNQKFSKTVLKAI